MSHKDVIPNEPDAYIREIIGKSRKELVSTHIKDGKGDIDKEANKAVTLANLGEETERLSSIVDEQSSSATLTDKCTELITGARSSISESKADDALKQLDDVKHYLIRAYESRKLWPKDFWLIVGCNILYLGVFIFLVVWQHLIPLTSPAPNGLGAGILTCAIWGGIGGVADALVALDRHFNKQDFDKQYMPWYYLHPFVGMFLGAIIYLVLQAGLATISNSNAAAGNATSTGTSTVQVGVTAFSIAVAVLAGFKQNAAIDFLTRVVQSVFKQEGSKASKTSKDEESS